MAKTLQTSIPIKLEADSFAELSKKLIKFQIQQGGRCHIIGSGQTNDGKWYYLVYPILNGGGVF